MGNLFTFSWSYEDENSEEPSYPILAFGNPLLDISCHVSREFFEKYGLEKCSMTLWKPSHEGIYEELSLMPTVEFIAGGSALNSLRVCQWILNTPNDRTSYCCYIGSIGTPEADLKQKDVNKDKVQRAHTSRTLDNLHFEPLETVNDEDESNVCHERLESLTDIDVSGVFANSNNDVFCLVNESRSRLEALRLFDKIPSKYLKDCIKQDNVYAEFLEIPFLPTGTCAVCISDDKERSMVTNLAAGQEFKLDSQLEPAPESKKTEKDRDLEDEHDDDIKSDLSSSDEVNKQHEVYSDVKYQQYRTHFFDQMKIRMHQARIIYAPGFFVNTSVDTLLMAGNIQLDKYLKERNDSNSVFALNLSAEFIIDACKDDLNKVLQLASHVFGNYIEVLHYGKINGMIDVDTANDEGDEKKSESSSNEKNLKEIARQMSLRKFALSSNDAEDRPLTVIVTHGRNDAIVAVQGEVQSYKVPAVDQSKIVDLNGAGDAFVGGFLSQLVLNKDLDTCIEAANYAAGQIIQRSGTNLANIEPPKKF